MVFWRTKGKRQPTPRKMTCHMNPLGVEQATGYNSGHFWEIKAKID